MGDFSNFIRLEQRIEDILSSDPDLDIEDIEARDFYTRDQTRAKLYTEDSLIDTLTAARGYELAGEDYDLERAYVLDRSARILDNLVGHKHDIKSLFRLYAGLKERSADLFRKIAEKKTVHNEDAGYSYLRAARGYARAGDIKKAKELVAKSDQVFSIVQYSDDSLKKKVISAIECGFISALDEKKIEDLVNTINKIFDNDKHLSPQILKRKAFYAKEHYKKCKYDKKQIIIFQ